MTMLSWQLASLTAKTNFGLEIAVILSGSIYCCGTLVASLPKISQINIRILLFGIRLHLTNITPLLFLVCQNFPVRDWTEGAGTLCLWPTPHASFLVN